MFKVIVVDDRTNGRHEEEKKILSDLQIDFKVFGFSSETEAFISTIADADALLVNLTPITKKTIDKLFKCKIIARYGVGTDNIDIEAASAKRIWVTSVPNAAVEEVATHCMGMLLALSRNLFYLDSQVRRGKWNIASERSVERISGKRMGFVGFGTTAKQFAARLQGFGLSEILAYDPFVDVTEMRRLGVKKVNTLESMLPSCDYVSLHIPASNETRGIINDRVIQLMKDGVIFINTARGSLVEESALIRALRNGKIKGAGLDVFALEPPSKESPLLEMENVILSDHSAYYSIESENEAKRVVARNVLRVLTGQVPDTPVNKF